MSALILPDAEATEALGSVLAARAPAHCVIYLHGDLGAGKTTLVRGLLRRLGHQGPVPSPTYTLLEPYELEGRTVLHLDLYRLSDPGELDYLGFRDYLARPLLMLVEWPGRGGDALPPADLEVTLDYSGDQRLASLVARTESGREMLSE